MLESEDPEMNQTTTTTNNTQEDFYIKRLSLMFGATCVINFVSFTNCNYNAQVYLVLNSILYIIFTVYMIHKKTESRLCLFGSVSFLVTIVAIYMVSLLAKHVSGIKCDVPQCPVCPVCPTSVPTFSPISTSTSVPTY